MAKVIVYSKSYCPFCKRVKELFNSKGIEFSVIDVENDEEKQKEMIEKAGGKTTVPQVFIDGKHIGGCDDTVALDQKGELDPLLNA